MKNSRAFSGEWHIPLFIIVIAIDGIFFGFGGTKRGLMIIGSFIAEETLWVEWAGKLLGID